MNISKVSNFLNVKINLQSSEKDINKFKVTYRKEQENVLKVLDGNVIRKGKTIYIVV